MCKQDVSGCEILRGTWRDLRLRDRTVYVHRALHKPDLKPVDMWHKLRKNPKLQPPDVVSEKLENKLENQIQILCFGVWINCSVEYKEQLAHPCLASSVVGPHR